MHEKDEWVSISRRELTALRESEERFRTICEHAPVMIDAFDQDGEVILWNRECERQLGYSFAEVKAAEDPLALVYPDPVDRARALENIAKADGEFREYRVRARDGSTHVQRWADFKLPTGASISVGHDVTEERTAAEELASSQAQLRRVQKMDAIDKLSGGIAHDFNNLLTVIMSNLALAKRIIKDSTATDYVSQALIASERGAELVAKLMRSSRNNPLTLVPCDLTGLLDGLAPTLRRLLPETLTLRIDVDATLPLVVADPSALEQALLNLATNARDAMGTHGTLCIAAQRAELTPPQRLAAGIRSDAPLVALRVSDDGVGMDAATLERAFEPFFTTKAVDKGAGLGLAMVYGLARQHRGGVAIASQPGTGTHVTIYLPIATSDAPAELRRRKAASMPPVDGSTTSTVLLVEDEAQVRAGLVAVLRAAGYRVLEAKDGADALERFLEHANDIRIVVSDAVMPIMTGPELHDELARRGYKPPFLLLTGHLREDLQVPAGLPILFKPCMPSQLLARVADLGGIEPVDASE